MDQRERRGKAGKWIGLLGLGALALLALRMLGPGGSRPEETRPEAPSPAPAPARPEVRAESAKALRGRILLASGAPAKGAMVEAVLEDAAGGKVEGADAGPLGEDGAFTLPAPGPGFRVVELRATLGPLVRTLDLRDAAGALDLEVRLPAGVAVSGIVVAAEDGRPLEGMQVRLGASAAVTDRLGRFSLVDVPPAEAAGEILVSGAGRKALRRALPAAGGLDDLLLSVEGE